MRFERGRGERVERREARGGMVHRSDLRSHKQDIVGTMNLRSIFSMPGPYQAGKRGKVAESGFSLLWADEKRSVKRRGVEGREGEGEGEGVGRSVREKRERERAYQRCQ